MWKILIAWRGASDDNDPSLCTVSLAWHVCGDWWWVSQVAAAVCSNPPPAIPSQAPGFSAGDLKTRSSHDRNHPHHHHGGHANISTFLQIFLLSYKYFYFQCIKLQSSPNRCRFFPLDQVLLSLFPPFSASPCSCSLHLGRGGSVVPGAETPVTKCETAAVVRGCTSITI